MKKSKPFKLPVAKFFKKTGYTAVTDDNFNEYIEFLWEYFRNNEGSK